MIARGGQAELMEIVALARSAHAEQDMESAVAAIEAAAKLQPDNPAIAFMHAQFAYEGWYEAAALFERAAQLNPGNADVVRNFALALGSEGEGARAERLLEGLLARLPNWIDGHNTLATLRVTSGDSDPWRSYAEAARREPNSFALYQGWFQRLVTAGDWQGARDMLAVAEKYVPGQLALLELYLACESGEVSGDPKIFAPFAHLNDPGVKLLQVRHALRHGDPVRALQLVEAELGKPWGGQFWPYCSLCWRLLGDDKAQWLEGAPAFATHVDLDISNEEIGKLASFLRDLHRMTAPYPEQSVRGGTQTDRNLLLHHDPAIQRLRGLIVEAVETWRDALPAEGAEHPLLSRKPEEIRFSGSWSVRLASGGHHSAHVHPQGWASSALYITVPENPGEGHAGELALGMAPPELGLDLEPTSYIVPKPARLALFPSTTWHGTVPFKGAERLTVAFDVAPNGWGK